MRMAGKLWILLAAFLAPGGCSEGLLDADAGSDQNIESDVESGTYVGTTAALSGIATGGEPPYQFTWTRESEVIGTSQDITVDLPVGVHDIVLSVSDTDRGQAQDAIRLNVLLPSDPNNTPPGGSTCGGFVTACDEGSGPLVEVRPLVIDDVPQVVTILEQQPFLLSTIPQRILVTGTNLGGAELIQLTGGRTDSCDRCTPDGPLGCTNTCSTALDGSCDDGGVAADTDLCAFGTDCADCAPRDDAGDCGECNIWTHNGIVFTLTEPNPQLTLAPGSHLIKLRVSDGFGENSSTEVQVIVNPDAASVVVGALASEYCTPSSCTTGQEITLSAIVFGGEPPYTYSWSPPEGLDDPMTSRPELTLGENTLFTVTVTDSVGTAGVARVSIGSL